MSDFILSNEIGDAEKFSDYIKSIYSNKDIIWTG